MKRIFIAKIPWIASAAFLHFLYCKELSVPGSNRGAITVEYALCMIVAVIIMTGVQMLFENMSHDLIKHFTQWVKMIP